MADSGAGFDTDYENFKENNPEDASVLEMVWPHVYEAFEEADAGPEDFENTVEATQLRSNFSELANTNFDHSATKRVLDAAASYFNGITQIDQGNEFNPATYEIDFEDRKNAERLAEAIKNHYGVNNVNKDSNTEGIENLVDSYEEIVRDRDDLLTEFYKETEEFDKILETDLSYDFPTNALN